MNNPWQIRFTKSVNKQSSKLSKKAILILRLLFHELGCRGPSLPDWPHYGKLAGKKGIDKRHCHLQRGRPTYVCCWEVLDKKARIIEVYYAGTHENAPY